MAQSNKEYRKAYYQAHKEEEKAKMKAWRETHKEEIKAHYKAWLDSHKEERKAYNKADVNSLGKDKHSIRCKSNKYLIKHGKKIPGYEIHHCCTYSEPYKFIYCSKEIHRTIHSYLREHNIDADSDHYNLIKHLLDDTVILYGLA
jgi:hypothetical protein